MNKEKIALNLIKLYYSEYYGKYSFNLDKFVKLYIEVFKKLGDKDFENYIEEYKFTIRTQQQMIDELINKIDKAIEYINKETKGCDREPIEGSWLYDLCTIRDILGDKENE